MPKQTRKRVAPESTGGLGELRRAKRIIQLQQELGLLRHQLSVREKALTRLTERLMTLEGEQAPERAARLDALREIFDAHWGSESWQLLVPVRNALRRLSGKPKEQKPEILTIEAAERWIRSLRESTSWKLMGPWRAANRIFRDRRTSGRSRAAAGR